MSATLVAATAVLTIGPAAAAYAQPASAPKPAPVSKTARGPMMFFNVGTTAAIDHSQKSIQPSIQPPPVLACLPVTPPSGVPGCVPPPPPAGEPWPVNMAYFGGHVQVAPKMYMVYWGWNTKGAFKNGCSGSAPTTGNWPACDPDGAGQRMYDFVDQMGGTGFAQVSTQYYQTNPDGSQTFVTNPTDQLGGVWVDDSSYLNLPSTASVADVQTALGKEATLAVAHFGLTPADLLNADIVIAQPQVYSDPAAASTGYCAWHDYTEPGIEGNVYNGDTYGVSFTNMPYILNQGSSCGQNAINQGPAGNLDGESIVLGHEIEETVTDPGAEDVINGQNLGGWYDSEEYEIGDKCAWVGQNLVGVGPQPFPVPGAVGTTTGNKGTTFPVQSLWSNEAANGVGWCAGAGTDLAASPGASVPEVPAALLIPVLGLATAFGGIVVRRRRRRAMAG
jgi:hypothetical protein